MEEHKILILLIGLILGYFYPEIKNIFLKKK
jgi:hypothetical protein